MKHSLVSSALLNRHMDSTQEQKAYEHEVDAIKKWWKSDRFRLIHRPYSAEDGEFSRFPRVGLIAPPPCLLE